MTTRELLLTAWVPGFALPTAFVLVLAAYAIAFRRRVSRRSGFFLLAVLVAFLALGSPIGVLARGYLFSAHMLQHLLLTLAVPPLVLLGLPASGGPSLLVPPNGAPSGPSPRRESHATLGTPVSWLLGIGAMWIWHAPTLCNAAATSPSVQGVQTVSLVVMGLAFWRPIVGPPRERLHPFKAILYLFTACLACTVLGVVVTLSPVEVCSAYLRPADPLGALPLLRDGWGLSCKGDQEIGGLLMWLPTCLAYSAAILATLGRYYAEESSSLAPAGGLR